MDDDNFKLLKREVDSIQIQLAKESGSWMAKPSNIMALFALLFSFGTTLVSAYNSYTQDIRENRKEARQLIQRLSKIPIENFELTERYKEKGAGQALSSMLNQENIVVAIQAAELIERFPSSFSSSELQAVGAALAVSNISHKVPFFYGQAVLKAETSNDYLVAARSFGAFLFTKGEIEKGNTYFQMALDTWLKFPEENKYFKNASDFQTYFFWSGAQLGTNNVEKAILYAGKANSILTQLQPGPFTDGLNSQFAELNINIGRVKNNLPRRDLQ
jgi:hypothetical protein